MAFKQLANGLTEMQDLFCELKMTGLSNQDAAKQAGYKINGNGNYDQTAIRSPSVRQEIKRRTEEELQAMAPMVLKSLRELSECDEKGIRFQASRDLANRMGLGESKSTQQAITFNVDLS